MSPKHNGGISEELQELVAAACENELSDRETERIEQILAESSEARRFYLLYLHLHGELHWHQAMAGEMPDLAAPSSEGTGRRIPTPTVAKPRRERISRLRLFGFGVCAAIVVTLLTMAYRAMPEQKPPSDAAPPVDLATAKLTAAVRARWEPGATPPATGQAIPLDRRWVLERGVIEITHSDGTRLLIAAPAAFRYEPGGRIEFESGEATVMTGPKPDLLISIGDTAVEPIQGNVGLSVDGSRVELHSLGGKATIRQIRSRGENLEEFETQVGDDDAVAWSTDSTEPPQPVSADPGRFALNLPDRAPNHSVARMRELVANHPRLIHQYTFEGTSRLEKCQDKRGVLHLTEAVMVGGRGRGSLDYTARGFDLTTEAIRPHREAVDGERNGTALQTDGKFQPPGQMTIELLLRYELPENADQDPVEMLLRRQVLGDSDPDNIALAVATRDGERNCGFYVAAVGQGHLSLLLDGEANWVNTNMILAAQHWYYLAVTWNVDGQNTIVNAYLADLTRGERELRQILDDRKVPGVPALSRLGIGKGFDATGGHAYPWSGELDEVAVYDKVLGQNELQAHVNALQAGD